MSAPRAGSQLAAIPESNAVILRRLELTITRRLDGLLQGEHRGLVPGHGSELGEARVYQPGDDVRRIDWNVSARMRETYVRDSIADRELECWLLIDQSSSLDFGTAAHEKRDLAVEAAGAVGFLTQRGGNRLGALLLRGDRPVTVPPRSGRQHLLAILQRMLDAPRVEGAVTDLGAGMGRLGAVMRRRGLAVVVSDFLSSNVEIWAQPLRRLCTRHDVLAIEVLDPRELELPDVGILTLRDPETGAIREVQTSDKRLRERYSVAASAQRSDIAAAIAAAGAGHLSLRTDGDWLRDLVQFVALRRRIATGAPANLAAPSA
ncbi:MAG: DUF58 domain-containing protein [Acidimicrobiales bacterium]